MAICAKGNYFFLENECVSYVMENKGGVLAHVYYGAKISHDNVGQCTAFYPLSFCCPIESDESEWANLDTLKCECPTAHSGDFREPSVVIKSANGSRRTDFRFSGYEISQKCKIDGLPSLRGGETLIISLVDSVQNIEIKQFYTIYDDCNAIARHNEIINHGDSDVQILKLSSFCLDIDDNGYKLISLFGKHSNEAQIFVEDLGRGVRVFESNCGITSHKQNPFMALADKNYTEYSGNIYGINLIYSGSFKLSAELNNLNNVRLTGGINDNDFAWTLEPKKSLVSPEAIIVFSDCGLNNMSVQFSALYKKYLLPEKSLGKISPIVLNSWEAAFFDYDEVKLKQIIRSAASTGIDTFVLDDGWFGARNSDKCALGDWFVNTDKIKCGLSGIINECKDSGLKFGIWIEPEMISEDSALFAAHPDWRVETPNYKPAISRNQYLIDLINDDAFEYLKHVFYDLLHSYDISYVKWDMNRYITENYSAALQSGRQQEFNHRYTLRLYELIDHLTSCFPDVLFEGCAGGGGRVDGGMLYYFPQIWASDSTDANERTKIMYGWSLCYPLSALSGHVSKCPNNQNMRTITFSTRADIAMLGAFGYELDLNELSKSEKDLIFEQCQLFKKIYHIVKNGDLYRLINPFTTDYFSVMVMNKQKTEGYLWFYQRLVDYGKTPIRLKLKGLAKERLYFVEHFNLSLSGDTLMNLGFTVPAFYEDFKSVLINIKEII